MNELKKRLKNIDGFTMMDVMIISGILLTMIASFSAYQFSRNKELKAQEARTNVNQVKENVRSSAVQAHSLSNSEELQFTSPGM